MKNYIVNNFFGILFVLMWTSELSNCLSYDDDRSDIVINPDKSPLDYRPAGMASHKNHQDMILNTIDKKHNRIRGKTGKKVNENLKNKNRMIKKNNYELLKQDSPQKRKLCGLKFAKMTPDVCPIVNHLNRMNDLLNERKNLQVKLNETRLNEKLNLSSEVLLFLEYIMRKIEEGNLRMRESVKTRDLDKEKLKKTKEKEGNAKEKNEEKLSDFSVKSNGLMNSGNDNNFTTTKPDKYHQITIGFDVETENTTVPDNQDKKKA